ncbi:hypothetical protein ACHAP5_003485 [Fusarium lateritium]
MIDKVPYKYQPLESPFHIRLMHLLPGKQGEDVRIRISHDLLEKPENTAPKRLTPRQLQKTLPSNWDVVETLEGRFLFMRQADDFAITRAISGNEKGEDGSDGTNKGTGGNRDHTWTHPDTTMDPKTYELPPRQAPGSSRPVFEALSYFWGDQRYPAIASIEDTAGEPIGSIDLRRDLATALEYLRYEQETRVLWVDAI